VGTPGQAPTATSWISSSQWVAANAELSPEPSIKERVAGDCSSYLVAITAQVGGELRISTDHDGPPDQRNTALASLTAHVKTIIGR